MTRHAVILAAGRGTRMQQAADVTLTAAQEDAADRGLKALVPVHGRPFLEWSIERLAHAGIEQVTLVVSPATMALKDALRGARIPLRYALQPEPRGSADAVLAARTFTGEDAFFVINGDNLYPVRDLERLARLTGPGLVAYRRSGLERGGIPGERVRAFALIDVTDGILREIVEKPSVEQAAAFGDDPLVSMTCWRFEPSIYDACAAVAPSVRGELELPDAVRLQLARGVRYGIVPSTHAVLDLTGRADIPTVEAHLAAEAG